MFPQSWVLSTFTNCQVQVGFGLSTHTSQKNSRFQLFLNCCPCLDSLVKYFFKLQDVAHCSLKMLAKQWLLPKMLSLLPFEVGFQALFKFLQASKVAPIAVPFLSSMKLTIHRAWCTWSSLMLQCPNQSLSKPSFGFKRISFKSFM